jgi:hypothetical protein
MELIAWWNNKTSAGFRQISHTKLITDVSVIIPAIARNQNHGELEITNPNNKRNVRAEGTRLRRRLSNIFQRDKVERGFFCECLSGPGT